MSDDRDVKQALSRLVKAAKGAVRKGTRAGAKIVQAKAKTLAPERTGAMAQTIKVRALPRSRKWIGTMARLVNDGAVIYGGFVNYGTKHIEAKRFLNKAADQTRDSATDEAIRVMADAMAGET